MFHIKCKSKGKVCKVIVENSSFDNIVSMEMIEKLKLVRVPHEEPYRAFGLSDDQWVDVFEKAYVPFSIGTYHDVVECDILPLRDCHLILGQAWQLDKATIYNGKANTYAFEQDGVRFVMNPLLDDDESWPSQRSIGFIERIDFPMHEANEEEVTEEVKECLMEETGVLEQPTPKNVEVPEVKM